MVNIREYGLGPSDGCTRSAPRILGPVVTECPNCYCSHTFSIEVDVEHPLLVGQKGLGIYVGCAACPWASPMVMMTAAAAAVKRHRSAPDQPPGPLQPDPRK